MIDVYIYFSAFTLAAIAAVASRILVAYRTSVIRRLVRLGHPPWRVPRLYTRWRQIRRWSGRRVARRWWRLFVLER